LNILPELAEHLWHGTLGGDLRTKSETHRHPTHRSARQHAILLLLLQPFYGHWTVWDYPGEPVSESYNQEDKANLDLLEQEIVSGNGISWAISKSAPCPRQITTPASHRSIFTGQMPFLLPNQQRLSTEGITNYVDK